MDVSDWLGVLLMNRYRKGIVGIEAAIILIAFVVIAAALAYVVVNTGFFASQKSKEVVMRGIGEATSSLQLDGSVIAYVNETDKKVTTLVMPVKVSVGKEGVDVSNNSLVVTVWVSGSKAAYMPNIYNGTLPTSTGTITFNITNLTETIVNISKTAGNKPVAYIGIVNSDGDNLLESNEKGFLIVYLGDYSVTEHDVVKVEVKAPIGASLIIEREIPTNLVENQFIDLR
jgi:flagellin FlaB